MGRIVCELCGSTDLIKQDGIFVCQSCGCKYSLEEVRKLIGEGNLTVQPVARADQSLEYNNLKQATYEAMVDGRFDSAYSNSIRLLTIKPDDPEMIAIQALVALGKDKMAFDIPSSTTNGLNRFYSMVSKWQEKYCIQIESISHVKDYVESACKAQSLLLREEASNLEAQKIKTTTADTLGAIGNALGALGGDIFSLGMGMNDDREGKQREAHNRVIESQIQKIRDKERTLDSFKYSHVRKLESLLKQTKRADAEYRAQRKQEYWKEHAEQKGELENRIKTLEAKRQPILDEIKSKQQQVKQIKDSVRSGDTPLGEKSKKLNAEIDRLSSQFNSLGIFKGREKKQLTERISSLRNQIPSFSELNEESKMLLNQLQPQIDEIQNAINSLQEEANQFSKQIVDLENELNMDR